MNFWWVSKIFVVLNVQSFGIWKNMFKALLKNGSLLFYCLATGLYVFDEMPIWNLIQYKENAYIFPHPYILIFLFYSMKRWW